MHFDVMGESMSKAGGKKRKQQEDEFHGPSQLTVELYCLRIVSFKTSLAGKLQNDKSDAAVLRWSEVKTP